MPVFRSVTLLILSSFFLCDAAATFTLSRSLRIIGQRGQVVPTRNSQNGTTVQKQANITTCINVKLTDAERTLALAKHNEFRSILAKGQAKNKGSGFAPPAKNMYKLKWDCALEATAQKWADTCVWAHSDRSFRNGSGENLFMQGGGRPTNSDLLKSAANGWWGELAQFGIPTNDVTLTTALFSSGVGHFTQMAWATTKSIGCGISKCKGGQTAHVVCHYGPSGNWINSPIYEIGSACKDNSGCTGGASTCSVGEGLCVWK